MDIRLSQHAVSLVLLLDFAAASPQAPPAPRGQRLVEITRAGERESVSCMAATQNGAAPTRNGGLFVPVQRVTFADAQRSVVREADLELWRSDDGGLRWRRAATMATRHDGNCALVPDGELLAVLWSAGGETTWNGVHFQRYDPRNDRWLGEPVVLAAGTSADDQYHTGDLVRTDGGALVAVIGNHALPQAPTWTCPWSTGMRWLAAGSSDWAPMVQVNVSSYGCAASAMARGDLVDITYRTNPGPAIHGLRTVDGRTGRFVQDADENVGPANGDAGGIANVGILCRDGTGGRSLLHVLADASPGKGRFAVSWSRPGEPVRTTAVADDAPLFAGNENPQHFTLARGPGNQVFVYFTKSDEGFQNLWQCVVEEGQPVGAAKAVAEAKDGAFPLVTGMRTSSVFSGLHVVVRSQTKELPGGAVSAFGSWPSRTVWLPRTS